MTITDGAPGDMKLSERNAAWSPVSGRLRVWTMSKVNMTTNGIHTTLTVVSGLKITDLSQRCGKVIIISDLRPLVVEESS